MLRTAALAGLAVLPLAACGQVCLFPPPCPAPRPALEIKVTPAGQVGAVEGLVVEVTGASTGQASCRVDQSCDFGDGGLLCQDLGNTCDMQGGAGDYSVRISAPGYRTITRSVTVKAADASHACCDSGHYTEHVEVELSPSM